MRRICLLIVFAACLQSAVADDSFPILYTHEIGFAAGYTTGYGLSYRQWFHNGYGVQLTCGPYYDKSGSTTNGSVSLGLTGLRMLSATGNLNLYLYLSGHWLYNYTDQIVQWYDYNYEYPYDQSVVMVTHDFYFGFGPALDIHGRRISFNIMTGLRYNTDFNSNFHIGPTIESALYFAF